jgi:hypothetical protein
MPLRLCFQSTCGSESPLRLALYQQGAPRGGNKTPSVPGCRDVYAIGSSGGACAAGLLFVPEQNLDEMVNFIGDCCDDCRSHIVNRFKVRQYVRAAVERFCPDDIAKRVTGRLQVSVTQLPTLRNIRWREFVSKVRLPPAMPGARRPMWHCTPPCEPKTETC